MFKEKIEKIKDMFKSKDGNNKRTLENLVLFIIITIITIVAINYIWSGDKKELKNTTTNDKALADNSKNVDTNDENDMNKKLETILSNIKGVGKVKVLITYSQTSQIVALYDEDTTTSSTKETDSRRWG